MNRIGFWWDIITANIEYYDIQYAAERTKLTHNAKLRNGQHSTCMLMGEM